jgi:hypothetical protein
MQLAGPLAEALLGGVLQYWAGTSLEPDLAWSSRFYLFVEP